jgi:H+-transporting ATPase
LKFMSYFWGPIPWMIEAAVVLSALVRHWPDFFLILVLLVVNAAIGFWEEYQAGNAIAALKAKLAIRAHVRRDGKWATVAARELVPGDVVRLKEIKTRVATKSERKKFPLSLRHCSHLWEFKNA